MGIGQLFFLGGKTYKNFGSSAKSGDFRLLTHMTRANNTIYLCSSVRNSERHVLFPNSESSSYTWRFSYSSCTPSRSNFLGFAKLESPFVPLLSLLSLQDLWSHLDTSTTRRPIARLSWRMTGSTPGTLDSSRMVSCTWQVPVMHWMPQGGSPCWILGTDPWGSLGILVRWDPRTGERDDHHPWCQLLLLRGRRCGEQLGRSAANLYSCGVSSWSHLRHRRLGYAGMLSSVQLIVQKSHNKHQQAVAMEGLSQ